jgi:hypothetical protein
MHAMEIRAIALWVIVIAALAYGIIETAVKVADLF